MLKATLYGGVAAKVRAMYARRLKPEDYCALSHLSSEAEIADYLRNHTSYADALAVPNMTVAEALSRTVADEFHRLYKLMQREDHPLLKSVAARDSADEMYSRSFEGLVQSTQYYSTIFTIITKQYKGDIAARLTEGFGGEVDMLNVAVILRIKQFFPVMRDETADYLIPLRHKLSPRLLRMLIDAPDIETAGGIIAESPLARLFPDGVRDLDNTLERRLHDFNLRVIRAPQPSVYTPLAYIILRKAELKSVLKLVECARYGIDAAAAGIYISGMEGDM